MIKMCFRGVFRKLKVFCNGRFGSSKSQSLNVPINILIYKEKWKKMCHFAFSLLQHCCISYLCKETRFPAIFAAFYVLALAEPLKAKPVKIRTLPIIPTNMRLQCQLALQDIFVRNCYILTQQLCYYFFSPDLLWCDIIIIMMRTTILKYGLTSSFSISCQTSGV